MIKKLFLTTQLLFCCFVLHSYARNEYASDSDRDLKRRNKMVKEAALLPDSAFEYVKMEDLLDDQVYMKLAHDGWSPQEIVTIMKTALKTVRLPRTNSVTDGMPSNGYPLTVSCRAEIRSTSSWIQPITR